MHIAIPARAEGERIWRNIAGKKILAKLIDSNGDIVVLRVGDREHWIETLDLSEADRDYLNKVDPAKKPEEYSFYGKKADNGLFQKYLDFGEEKNLIDAHRIERVTRETLTAIIKADWP